MFHLMNIFSFLIGKNTVDLFSCLLWKRKIVEIHIYIFTAAGFPQFCKLIHSLILVHTNDLVIILLHTFCDFFKINGS